MTFNILKWPGIWLRSWRREILRAAKPEALGSIKQRLATTSSVIRSLRASNDAGGAPQDFKALCIAWGVREKDIPAIVRRLKIEGAGYIALTLLYAAQQTYMLITSQNPFSLIQILQWGTLLIVSPALTFMAFTRFWRASVLNHKRFTSFSRWMMGR